MVDNFSKFGRSGCNFYLDDKGITLRKISSGVEYNNRLYSQYLKQYKFEPIGNFSTPSPQNFDKLSTLYTFDMEYIYGKTFETFCIDSNINDIKYFSSNLNHFISSNLKNSITTEVNFDKLSVKIEKLKEVLDKEVEPYLEYLLQNKLLTLPIGKNHGDFTLSNIIFSDKYYLIDFLDNPFETPLNDLVKIKQDTEHNFYFNLLGKCDTKIKICLDYLDNELNKTFKDIIETKEFIWLSIFNLLRILPYLKNKSEKEAILKNLQKYECYLTSSGKIK